MNALLDSVAPKLVLVSAAAIVAAGALRASADGTLTVYVGTYTDTTSKGIYRFTLDPETGAMTAPVLAAETRNPSFLALHPGGRYLYAVGEMESFEGKKGGAVSAFAVDPRTGELRLLNQQPSEGGGPCHLVVDRAGRHVLVANYGGGNVAVLPIGPDGRLARASSIATHEGSGPNADRQQKPHAHGVYLSSDERFAFSPDLGADRVFVYRYDAEKGTLQAHGAGVLPPGSGPRHLAFDPREKHAYVINELLSTITAFAYDAAAGTLTAGETVTTLPAGFAGPSFTAEVAVSPDGRFVYGSNRGHDSLAVFARDPGTGRLTPAGHVALAGKTPRHFTFDPTGRFVLAGHQGSDTVEVLRVDQTTGHLAAVGGTLAVGKPVCLLPVRR